ncbi:MAG: exodeoxyribonuclease VII small subunit [Paludibacteraceae bacterium]|nr:exodeoxyribonuclease VII small subunit [Paludibacteraceae bacterium]
MSKQKTTYSSAVAELEDILSVLENSQEMNMDVISEKVKRAALLIDFCKKQLHELDSEMEKIIGDLKE